MGKRKSPEHSNAVQPNLSFSDGDLIIQSSDKEQFQVHKFVLSLASTVFKDMFSLDNVNSTVTQTEDSAVPIVPVTESAGTMNVILRYIYPADKPSFNTLEEIMNALKAADKYIIPAVTKQLENDILLGDFVEKEPLRLYILAKRYSLEKLERAALPGAVRSSTKTLTSSLTPSLISKEATSLSFEEFFKLQYFAKLRAEYCIAALEDEGVSWPNRVCECIALQRVAADQFLDEHPEHAGHLDYASEGEESLSRTCTAWDKFTELACHELKENPSADVFDAKIRIKAIQETNCRDALKLLFDESINGRINKLRRRLDALPWEYTEEYLGTCCKSSIRRHNSDAYSFLQSAPGSRRLSIKSELRYTPLMAGA